MQQPIVDEAILDRPTSLLLSLPAEILIHILSFIDIPSLGRLEQTCHDFLALGRDQSLWRSQYATHFTTAQAASKRNQRKRQLPSDWQETYKLAYVNRQNHLGRDAFYQAIARDDHSTAEALWLENNFGINTRDLDLRTPLHHACLNGAATCLNWLISNHALKKIAKDHVGNTALHYAAMGGHSFVVLNILANVSSLIHYKLLNAVNADHMTPLDLAAQHGHSEMVQTLLSNGADIEGAKRIWRRPTCHYPIHYAVISGHFNVVKVFAQRSSVLLTRSNLQGNSIYHLCVLHRRHEILEWLMSKPVLFRDQLLEKPNHDGLTPRQLAENNGDIQSMRLLASTNSSTLQQTHSFEETSASKTPSI
jgi:ankyrin repeat protein